MKKRLQFITTIFYFILFIGISALWGSHFHNSTSNYKCPDTKQINFTLDNNEKHCCHECCNWDIVLYHIFEVSINNNIDNNVKEYTKIFFVDNDFLIPIQIKTVNALKFLRLNNKFKIPKDLFIITLLSNRSPPVTS